MTRETSSITDNDLRQTHISRTIHVDSIVSYPHPHRFYNGIGRIDADKVARLLDGGQQQRVVGWYKYKPMAGFKFSFREQIVHRQLAELFRIPCTFFACCLLIDETSDNASTHLYTQNFIRFHNNTFEQLALHIVNLSDSNRLLGRGGGIAGPLSATFKRIVHDLNVDYETTQGLAVITRIQTAMQTHVDAIVDGLREAEEHLFALSEEVRECRRVRRAAAGGDHSDDGMFVNKQ